jgi:hypothetical protein
MAEAGPAIEVKGLCKSFGSTAMLDGIDFTVAARSSLCAAWPQRGGQDHGHQHLDDAGVRRWWRGDGERV